jgi:hypothetical protein
MLSAKCRVKFALDDTNPDHVDIVIYNYRWRLSLNSPMNWRWLSVGMRKVPSELG